MLGSCLRNGAESQFLTPGLMDPKLQPKFVEPVGEDFAESTVIILPTDGTVFEFNVYSILQETRNFDWYATEDSIVWLWYLGANRVTAWSDPGGKTRRRNKNTMGE